MLYPNNKYINPRHKIKVALIGCGGTGSRVLVELSALSQNLVEMDHLGFEIHVFDNDKVEQHNIGRQMFYQSDLGLYKSNVLATRINRSYGDNIKSYTNRCTIDKLNKLVPDIIITCIDSVGFRKTLSKTMHKIKRDIIWIDTGNGKNSGQIIQTILQDGNLLTPTCLDLFPDMQDSPEEPSCSTRQALKKQSFTVNKFVAMFTIQFMTNIFIDYQIPYTQLYFNLNPFKVKTK